MKITFIFTRRTGGTERIRQPYGLARVLVRRRHNRGRSGLWTGVIEVEDEMRLYKEDRRNRRKRVTGDGTVGNLEGVASVRQGGFHN
jgi:hypothetical protein